MKISSKDILRVLISLSVGCLILYLAYKDQDLDKLWAEFSKANIGWILVCIALGFVANYWRALRWRQLLEPLGYSPSAKNMLNAVMGAYLANFLIPRLGEVARCGMINKSDNVPVNVSIGTVIAERLMDLLSLIVITLLAIILEFERLKNFASNLLQGLGTKLSNPGLWLALFLALVGGIVAYLWLSKRKKNTKEGSTQKIFTFVQGLLKGLISLKDVKNIPLFILYTVLIWAAYFGANYVLFLSIEPTVHLSLLAGLSTLVMGSFGMAAPVQGGIGAYHVMVSQALMLYGISQTDSMLYAGLAHTVVSLGLIVTGALTIFINSLIGTKSK